MLSNLLSSCCKRFFQPLFNSSLFPLSLSDGKRCASCASASKDLIRQGSNGHRCKCLLHSCLGTICPCTINIFNLSPSHHQHHCTPAGSIAMNLCDQHARHCSIIRASILLEMLPQLSSPIREASSSLRLSYSCHSSREREGEVRDLSFLLLLSRGTHTHSHETSQESVSDRRLCNSSSSCDPDTDFSHHPIIIYYLHVTSSDTIIYFHLLSKMFIKDLLVSLPLCPLRLSVACPIGRCPCDSSLLF